jgi:hypothetical protein
MGNRCSERAVERWCRLPLVFVVSSRSPYHHMPTTLTILIPSAYPWKTSQNHVVLLSSSDPQSSGVEATMDRRATTSSFSWPSSAPRHNTSFHQLTTIASKSHARRPRTARRRPRRRAAAEEVHAVLCRVGGQQLGKRSEGDGHRVLFVAE